MDYNGASNWVEVTNATNLTLSSFSISAWINTTSGTGLHRICTKPASGGQNYSLLVWNGKAHIRFDRPSGLGAFFAESTTSVDDGKWHHLMGVFDNGANTIQIYVDGKLEQTSVVNFAPVTSSENLYIGKFSTNYQQWFNGQIDEVRIWNRVLTQTEIQQNMCKKLTGTEAGLVGYWRFDDCGGLTATDASGNGNNGTLN